MISLSTPAKEAIKTGLAMVIVFGIAFLLGWDKPEWGGNKREASPFHPHFNEHARP